MLPHRKYTNSIRHVIVSEITIVIKCILYTVSEGKNVIKPYLYFMYSGLGGTNTINGNQMDTHIYLKWLSMYGI